MKLISLEMKNFRQHVDTSIVFQDGVTGIIGPNGAGKTTILEAIAWTLYGSPAVRGTNDTIRSTSSDGGAKASAALTFELGGQIYKATRSLDSSGRSGQAVLEVDGRPLRTGMTEVSEAVARILGMDYRAFFTSFFTAQKELEFMAALDGRQREAAISRMLGYDRLTKAREQANQDKIGLGREIDGLEKGLADPEELEYRKKEAESALAEASAALAEAESEHKSAQEALDKLKPLKDASDQKAKRHEELTRRLEIDKSDLQRSESRLEQVRKELVGFDSMRKELESLLPDLKRYEEAGQEFKRLKALQEYEGERRQIEGQIKMLESEMNRDESRLARLASAQDRKTRAGISLAEAENLLAQADEELRKLREDRVAQEQRLAAQIAELESSRANLQANRVRIAAAGSEGKCPTCERPLAGELETVLGNFDAAIDELARRAALLTEERYRLAHDTKILEDAASNRQKLAQQVEALRNEKAEADAQAEELERLAKDAQTRHAELRELQSRLEALPKGFDQARFRELQRIGDELKPVYKRSIELQTSLKREPEVRNEEKELCGQAEDLRSRVSQSEESLAELAFSSEEHRKIAEDFDSAAARLSAAAIEMERRKGEVAAASAVLQAVIAEEEKYKYKLEELKSKRSERLHLQALADAFDKLRAELNDRIRPELESVASELLAVITDGRYNVVRVNNDYKAVIVDDGEEKPVISGGENDIVNLALRLAISQMIADRAGQSFSLLILDEVFGSLDETRRDNVVALLQSLKNRFEQIILITHVESIHDAVDNCLWVEFDEKTKTSRLVERAANDLVPVLC